MGRTINFSASPFQVVIFITFHAFAFADERPNILFIFTDDHATQALSAYGSKLIETPNLDRIADGGMRFDRCYVTNSICGPSRACILTGKYSHKNGYYNNDEEFDGTQRTFPKLLQQAGYQTALIGKWHLGRKSMPTGFDYWHILEHQGYYYQPKFVTPWGQVQYLGYTTDLLTEQTLAWLKQGRDPEKPFMLMMQHKAPHRPWDPAPDRLTDNTDHVYPEPDNLFDDYENRSSAAARAEMRIAEDNQMSIGGPDLKAWDREDLNNPNNTRARDWFYGKMTHDQLTAWKAAYREKNKAYYDGDLAGKDLVRWKYQRFLQDYLSCVASVDDSVGKVLDYLDEAGLADNTVVIYSSDQGFFLGEHGWFDKRFMYEESLRAPLLVRWPGVTKPGSVEKRIVSNLDFAETFLDLANAEIPADMQGASLEPLLRETPPADWRDSFYYHYYEGADGGHKVCEHYGVTNGRYKLINFYKLGEWELFDLENDPQEMHSVYGKEKYADVQATMLAELQRLRSELEVTENDPDSK
ncbi:sulfatase family protein [Bythopirellula polymerisocia]|uniref:Arylsulfatase n=1 Tax=Bythopirellula polymerisocia TaxID=2528003 RepID=A0A5C6D0F8_9BACT|nr:sulfatase [Bythopirellula polymerisocia]TWU29314.1 Arylsulfatase [Bythopirellula polymerisocia]